MDPEQTFIRVQERFSKMLTPRIRVALEYIYLVMAIALFCLLVVMHANYVQQPGCSSELSGVETAEAQLVQIKITSSGLWSQNAAKSNLIDISEQETSTENLEVPNVDGNGLTFLAAKNWLNWISAGARRSKLVFKSWKTDNELIEPLGESSTDISCSKPVVDEVENHIAFPTSARESLKASFIHFCSKWLKRASFVWGHVKQVLGNFRYFWLIFHPLLESGLGLGQRQMVLKKLMPLLFVVKLKLVLICTVQKTAGMDLHLIIPKWSQLLHLERLNSFAVEWVEKRSKAFEPTYIYTVEKGYFLLPEGAKSRHNIRTVNISISATHSCFGNRWQQLLINRFVGYDTILMNSLLNSPGQGYLYNYQTKEFYDLSYAHEPARGSTRFGDYFVTKCGVLMMSLFVFFTTTMSVSFTLRETQTRMLRFTVQLQHHARHQLPTFQLIFVHVIESLVFVPIMIGILFFLFEFYDDQLLAFMVLILVWLCELFTLISVRTPISMKFFPRFFLLYFLVFHIYFFSYAYGFSYLAFSATAAFMQHLILYFWNRFEVPALQRFLQNRRSQLQQPPDFHITSSTILASTLHITRLNTRNTGTINGNPGSLPAHTSGLDQARSPNDATEEAAEINNPDSVGSPLQFPESPDPQQAEANSSPGSLNSFSSLLLWILGGASSEGLNSFFSMFRDVRDQGQVFAESPRQENQTAH